MSNNTPPTPPSTTSIEETSSPPPLPPMNLPTHPPSLVNNIFGVVNGTIPQPVSTHPQQLIWIRCDRIAHSWINSSLSPSVLETLLNYNCPSANNAWTTLNQLFLDNVSATQMQLCYKSIREPLQDGDLVAQTLLGLPVAFNPFIIDINAMSPRPTFEAAIRPLLLSEEDRVQASAKVNIGALSLLLYSNTTPSFVPNASSSQSRSVVHSNGTSPPFKSGGSFTAKILGSSPCNHKQLCQICEKGFHSANNCSNRFNHAYTSTKLQHYLAAMHIDDHEGTLWYLDSGASAHITGDSSLLHSLIPYYGSTNVRVGNGPLLSITHIAQSTPSFSNSNHHLNKKNLLSIHKLCLDNKCIIEFSPSNFFVKDQQTLRILHL
ncbi:hypothetical protein LIER_35538 [Lithospermum erythrorhizon]|uniref:Retrovirus-related Pol polyprotein from transposon TNT 1-94-like beta-barrel domain-containing protein n=1 Tax=Lithospermum erythrorhizon TaxID=34254 RepID=A0AAV3NUX4_LITER